MADGKGVQPIEVPVPKELHWKLKLLAIKRRKYMYQVVNELIEQEINNSKDEIPE